jgi:hypothetical protein
MTQALYAHMNNKTIKKKKKNKVFKQPLQGRVFSLISTHFFPLPEDKPEG